MVIFLHSLHSHLRFDQKRFDHPELHIENQILHLCQKKVQDYLSKLFNKILRVDVNIPKLTSTVISRFYINLIKSYKSCQPLNAVIFHNFGNTFFRRL